MLLIYAVCEAGTAALTSLCPVVYLVSHHVPHFGGNHYEVVCTCAATPSSSSGSCGPGWVVTSALTDTCDRTGELYEGLMMFGFGLCLMVATMTGMLVVTLRNRQRMEGLYRGEVREGEGESKGIANALSSAPQALPLAPSSVVPI